MLIYSINRLKIYNGSKMKLAKIFKMLLVLGLFLSIPAQSQAQPPQEQPKKSQGVVFSSKGHDEDNCVTIERKTNRQKYPALPPQSWDNKPDNRNDNRNRFGRSDRHNDRDYRNRYERRDHSDNRQSSSGLQLGFSVGFETGAERYFHRNDPVKWPGASSQFTVGLQAEFFSWLYDRSYADDVVVDIFGQIDDQVAARLVIQPELSLEEQTRMSMVLLRNYVENNVKILAIDQDGNYFIMLNEQEGLDAENGEDGEWIKTPVTEAKVKNAAAELNQRFYNSASSASQTPASEPQPPSESVSDRFKAASEAWKN
jgi:hypothetical protein